MLFNKSQKEHNTKKVLFGFFNVEKIVTKETIEFYLLSYKLQESIGFIERIEGVSSIPCYQFAIHL